MTAQQPRKRRHWVQVVVGALLIAIPAGYGVVAAQQSRAGDGEKELKAEMAGLVADWPARTQRSIYQVPIPYNATGVAYFESNTWRASSLYVQFTTTGGGLDTFLAQLGTSRAELKAGEAAITPEQAKRVGWVFGAGHAWAGITMAQAGHSPEHHITVDLDNPDRPAVFVVSTVAFH